MPALARFMHAQGQPRSSEEYLRHWYFGDPQAASTVMIGSKNGEVVCMATMKHHHFTGEGGVKLVAMPQKVLTDASLRGKGIFQKLYWASEADARSKGAGFFLTVTNAASTPIFLGRFGYHRLPAPGMRVLSPRPGAIGDRPIGAVPSMRSDPGPNDATWRMMKPQAHLQWRYTDHPLKEYAVHAIGEERSGQGMIFTKRIRKKGLPVLLLMDAVADDPSLFNGVLQLGRRLAWSERCVAMLALRNEVHEAAMRDSGFSWAVSSGFNLLVKGLDAAHSEVLLGHRFDLTFGDLDFF